MAGSAVSAPRILLVGPNPFEPRKSMWLFVECLAESLPEFGFAPRILRPTFPRLGNIGNSRAAKVALRLILEAAQLRRAAKEADLVHIGDHASAFHLVGRPLRRKPTVVTCHDVFYIAGALGGAHPAPRKERWWQQRILRGIAAADHVACISVQTRTMLAGLIDHASLPPPPTSLIPVALFQTFTEMPPDAVAPGLAAIEPRLRADGYVLHVGGNFARKNREQVVRTFAAFGPRHGLQLVLAGEKPDGALTRVLEETGMVAHTVVVAGASVETLGLLYQGAFALLFPSHAEGFGLPPIEAQTLGCPVVASDIPPHVENLVDTALLGASGDTTALAAHLESLTDPARRAHFAAAGRINARRFSRATMIENYGRLYRSLCSR